MKKMLCVVCALGAAAASAALPSDTEAEAIAREKLSGLSLKEKTLLLAGSGTMTIRVPGEEREWQMSDSSHTVRADMERWSWDSKPEGCESTVLPTLSALAATWNIDLAAAFGHVIGEEARARGKDQMLGPGVNIMRTPLCGRNWEYMTEDPCLASKLVVPEIKAMQSHGVAATVKHFALNNQELNRNNVDTICDERTLNEIYLPAFEAAVKESGAWAVMTAYNKVNGDWCSENAYLQRGILRDRWHFPGMIITDWGGQHSTVKAALNGGGVEGNHGGMLRYNVVPKEDKYPLAEAVERGELPESIVDEMAFHTLWTMAKAGFFSPETRETGSRNTPEHKKIAREIAEEAIVLLKNDAGVLPLDAAKMRKIVVVGKLADTEMTRKGWSAEGTPPYEITPLKGLVEYFGERETGNGKRGTVKIVHLPLVAADSDAPVHDVIESSIGTFDTEIKDAGMSVRSWEVAGNREHRTRDREDTWNGFARKVELTDELKKYDRVSWHTKLLAPETGDYTFGVKMDHRAGAKLTLDGTVIADRQEIGDLTCQVRLDAGKEYDFTIEYRGDTGERFMNFGWRLPSESGNLEDVRKEAADADAVLVFTGTEVGHGQALECEGGDRPNLRLPDGHDAAIAELLSWDLPNFVVVTHSGAPLELPWADKAATILHEPYLGQEAGRALSRVLFGDVNPSGKLPCTWPRRYEETAVAQCGTYTADKSIYNEGIFVGYRWHDAKKIAPLFPFGYGLSYTTFEYGDVKIAEDCGKWEVEIDVVNTGKMPGKEIVQLYVSPVDPKVPRPPKELKAFAKVSLKPGETKKVELTLSPRDFSYWDTLKHDWRMDQGNYRLLIGSSAAEIHKDVSLCVD